MTLRLAYMACEYFNADYGLAIVRAEHQAFYRRVFLHETWREPRFFPGLLKPVGLMAAHFPRVRERCSEPLSDDAFERLRAADAVERAASAIRRRPMSVVLVRGAPRSSRSPDESAWSALGFADLRAGRFFRAVIPPGLRFGQPKTGHRGRVRPRCLHRRATFTNH